MRAQSAFRAGREVARLDHGVDAGQQLEGAGLDLVARQPLDQFGAHPGKPAPQLAAVIDLLARGH